MLRANIALSAAALLSSTAYAALPAHATTTPTTPYSITSLTAVPGPNLGEMTFTWAEDGRYTTSFLLETGLTSFSKTDPALPVSGRNAKLFTISRSVRTYTLSAAQVASASAPVPSGNHLYFRLAAVNTDSSGATAKRYYPYLRAVLPRPQAPRTAGAKMRIASFNVRTARALTDARSWLQRAPDVAQQIVAYNPGLVAVQELGPGRADGQTGTLDGHIRQTDSLQEELDKANGGKYDLVRTTPYVQSGVTSGTQGMRILYDKSRYVLRSSCPETTDGRAYSSSCSFKLPILSTDTESARRRAAYAQFEDRATGERFWFVSLHLDERHSDVAATEATYNTLRTSQADTVASTIDGKNPGNLPVMIGGDINSWQNNRVGNGPHDTLIAKGYYDTSAAVTRKNFQYPTINDFKLTMTPASQGVGVRIDMMFVKGAEGASFFENVMEVTDDTRPSDHNMIVADIAPFTSWGTTTVRSSSRK